MFVYLLISLLFLIEVMKKYTFVLSFVFIVMSIWACGQRAMQPEVDPQAAADSARVAEIRQEEALGDHEWTPAIIARVQREDSLIRAGYERAGGEDVYNRWLPMQEILFKEFLKNRTQANKQKLMDYIAEHNMCLIVPQPFAKEMLRGEQAPEDRGIHPRLILWEQEKISKYLDFFLTRGETPERWEIK